MTRPVASSPSFASFTSKGNQISRRTPATYLVRFTFIIISLAVLSLGAYLYARTWAPDKGDYPTQGVSVDSSNGEIEWGTLAAQDADFAYIRAIDGMGQRDDRFSLNWQQARDVGLRYGAMIDVDLCYPAPDLATAFIATVPRDNAALPPVLRLTLDPKCKNLPLRDAVMDYLEPLIATIESHAAKTIILNITEDVESKFQLSGGINRTLWLNGNFFAPDYADRPWVIWTANNMRHIDGIEGPVRWDVVAP